MIRRFFFIPLLALLIVPMSGYAQSLGEVARQQKDGKNQKSGSPPASTPKKVYTDEDFGSSESKDPGAAPTKDKAGSSTGSHAEKEKQPTMSADEWRAKIQRKKDIIAALQDRIDKLDASVNYVQNNRNLYTNAPEYNAYQHRKQLAAEQLKGVLEQQKTDLSDLQDQARQQGFGNSVYQ
jgi:hypothetical protein